MTHEDFSDLVSPGIRNAPIVRELDTDRRRELTGSLILAVPLVAVLLFSVWQHFELLQHGYRYEQMRQEYTRQQELNRHLRLEIETLRTPARIERVAIGQLRMVVPAREEELLVERAAAAPGGVPAREEELLVERAAAVPGGVPAREEFGERAAAGAYSSTVAVRQEVSR